MQLKNANIGDRVAGFELIKKQFVPAHNAALYTLRHGKTGAELLYFDRAEENKTFAIGFKTLPEDDTGVFHILEHSVLNGSKKYPVKEPFVSLLQSSMQTFLNAMTFSDKTLYPVSSRNEKDFFNLMAVYLDAVFCPAIYERPEIFMQEGWHYEFESAEAEPYYNGVVFSEMKGALADTESIIETETNRLLYPDSCYGFVSGGDPAHIPELSWEQFVNTHRRFYHPTNAKIFLDGRMDVDTALAYIDGEYLSHYDRREPDFDFTLQTPQVRENTVYYESQPGEEALAHMAIAKILCTHRDVETIYAARVLADYLTGTNESPLKRAFLEAGLAQDVSFSVGESIYQPNVSFVVRNMKPEDFDAVKAFLPQAVKKLLSEGLDKKALAASLEREAFVNREIVEPYGVELAIKALDSWLYGGDPLTHIDNAAVFDALRAKLGGDWFENLLQSLLGRMEDMSVLYLLPLETKGEDDARREAESLSAATAQWSAEERQSEYEAFLRMQRWQQSQDDETALATLPHLALSEVEEAVTPTKTELLTVANRRVLQVQEETNGIVYLRLYFDLSDLDDEQLCMANVLTICLGELRTADSTAAELQTRIKTLLGALSAKIEIVAKSGELDRCTPYLLVSASMLEQNAPAALELLEEILLRTQFSETDKIAALLAQTDYFQKQDLIANGHLYARAKAFSAFSAAGAREELLEGESFTRWFTALTESFRDKGADICDELSALSKRVFTSGRLFAGFGGAMESALLAHLIEALPNDEPGERAAVALYDAAPCTIEIPGGVGYSVLGHNFYALGSKYTGSCAVLSSLMTYSYLWNAVRVQGGAYGTGMNIRPSGDVFCYSYRDPNLENTRAAFAALSEAMDAMLSEDMELDDVIISTVNTTDPLLDPAGICALECTRYLKGTTPETVLRIRREILHTTGADLRALIAPVTVWLNEGKYCAVSDKNAVAFVSAEG